VLAEKSHKGGLFMKRFSFVTPIFGLLAVALPAGAVDGVKLIKQPKAFPIVISQPGSYRLRSNITVPDENTTAISVQADYVTIDLNGFTIQGPVVCTGTPVTSCSPSGGTGSGVDATGHVGVTVRNGTVHGMGKYGIFFVDRVENVTVGSNAKEGIYGGSTVTNCIANGNGRSGIAAIGTVANSSATGNFSYGIATDNNVIDCVANGNGGGGIYARVVTNCSASSNVGYGIAAASGTVTSSRAYSNSVFGIDTVTATGCMAAFNGGSPQISATGVAGHNICGDPGTPCP
jgi:hypothetical protein